MPDGILLIDKPAGKTSHDIVAAVRRTLPRKTRVGHAGTLDPFATGLLLVLVGRATRIQRHLMGLPKSYETVARLGWTSTTGDPEGGLTETGTVPPDPPLLPTGTITQIPPAYSAIKIDGKRAYARARAGEEFEVPSREVEVTRFEQLWRAGDRAAFAIDCSSGTYVRSLVADLEDAYCLELRRTAIGPFAVGDADPERLVNLAAALTRIMPVVMLAGEEAKRVAHGRAIAADHLPAGSPILLMDTEGAIAIAERQGSELKPVVGFRA